MLDTDGRRHSLYLDDLHQRGGDVMCEILELPGGERSSIVLVDAVPDGFQHFAPLQAMGRLALRDGPVPHLIWITEASHTGKVEEAEALARTVAELPPAYDALREARAGVYIDALDVHADGVVDLTPGFLEAPGIRRA
jgi:hypothetical protein